MAITFSISQIVCLKREAKKLCHKHSISHSKALDLIAKEYGFKNWSLLIKHSEVRQSPKPTQVSLNKPQPPASKRYYLHGDQIEDSPEQFYCARCDLFCDASHFEDPQQHSLEMHGERYLRSLRQWHERTKIAKRRWHRPDNASNLLAERAIAERNAYETARSPFHRWMFTQSDRNDSVGRLAVDIRRDKTFPAEAATYHELENYLSRYGERNVIALRQAWCEFSNTQMSF